MATPRQRIFAFVLAMLFLLSTVAFTGLVVYQMQQDRQNNEISGQFDTTNNESADADLDINNEQREADMLQGTKLENFEPVTGDVAQLQKIDIKEGDGEEVKPGATVTAHYTGAYATTGEIFQSSKDNGQPIPFGLDQVIPGWTEGVPGMKVGGTRRLIIPGGLAYGEAPEGYTPGSTARPMGPLVFDIEIVEVQNP